MNNNLFIGVMTGTSADGLDVTLAAIHDSSLQSIDSQSLTFPPKLRSDIKSLCAPSQNELFRAHSLGVELSKLTAEQINILLLRNKISPDTVSAIGFHGQTIRHHPEAVPPFSVQIGCASTLAHLTKINTITDFRMADMAAGGQGAPLVPAFHQAVFHSANENRIIINIGGIANITLIPADKNKSVLGLDTGPGNTLLDEWIYLELNRIYDSNGDWARTGKVIPELLNSLMNDPYIKRAHPKSTGKEYFNLPWLNNILRTLPKQRPEDIQRTLVEFTCLSICKEIQLITDKHHTSLPTIYLCGGGINNKLLIETLENHLVTYTLKSTLDLGIDPQLVEASAFAWLASRTMLGLTGNLKTVTGASQGKILGGIYPPS